MPKSTRPHRESLLRPTSSLSSLDDCLVSTGRSSPADVLTDADDSSTDVTADSLPTVDDIISKIGFGRFQLRLLILCGFGWFSDNMWLQAISTIMPRVQQHFDIPDERIGIMSSAMFSGMAVGALFWGVFSDRYGRKLAFNLTLILSAVFGLAACLSPQYWVVCLTLAAVGFGVGGNMPVDGALFLEFIPREKQYLLTMLSVFFSFGSVLTAGIAWAILPSTSCLPPPATCPHPERDNQGWRYVIGALTGLNIVMFIARIFWLKMEESPKFLLAHSRPDEARRVLARIVDVNSHGRKNLSVLDEPTAAEIIDMINILIPDTDKLENGRRPPDDLSKYPNKPTLQGRLRGMLSSRGTDGLGMLFTRPWLRTTLLVWAIWILLALAYTMFSAFLPIFLQQRGVDSENSTSSDGLSGVYRGYFIYCLFSVPGPIIGGYLADTKLLGRRWTMVLSTIATSGCMLSFALVNSQAGMTAASAGINFFAYIMYAVVYTYTPEVFESTVRGSACGIASSLGRLYAFLPYLTKVTFLRAGIVAPTLTGVLLTASPSLPLWISTGLFIPLALCMALLPIETRGRVTK